MTQNPLSCPKCGAFRYVTFRLMIFGVEPRAFTMRMPMYECKSCSVPPESIIPLNGPRLVNFCKALLDDLSDGSTEEIPLNYLFSEIDVMAKFSYFDHLGFEYDPRDYHFIPGLARQWNDGYLTPVFFDQGVLLYYNNHPSYSVKLTSFSSGNIYHSGKPMFSWGFGINRSGLLFMWLGDLDKDLTAENERDKRIFQAHNVPSDHDLSSKFYLSQLPSTIEEAFQKSDNEFKIFELKNELDEQVQTDFGFDLSKIDIERLTEFYRPPIIEDREQIFNAYLSLTKYLIETIQTNEIKNILLSRSLSEKDLKGLGSLKLFEKFVEKVLLLTDHKAIMAPLYVLYDLRLLQGHLAIDSFEEKYASCKQRLSFNEDVSDMEFYKGVVKSLIQCFTTLTKYDRPI